MQRYMTVKYAFLLLCLVALFGFVHAVIIAPFLSCFIVDVTLSQFTQTVSLFIIEPVISILIMVILINRKEAKIYDSLL